MILLVTCPLSVQSGKCGGVCSGWLRATGRTWVFRIACGSENTLVGPAVVAFKAALKQNNVPFIDIVTGHSLLQGSGDEIWPCSLRRCFSERTGACAYELPNPTRARFHRNLPSNVTVT